MSHWYRRLGFQLWLWAVLPLTLMLVAVSLNGVYSHQVAMRDFVAERDLGMARLYAGAVQNALANGTVLANGTGLSQVLGAIPVGPHTMLYLADADGRLLYSPMMLSGQDTLVTTDPGVTQVLTSSAGTVNARLWDHAPSLLSFAAVPGSTWRVLLEEPESEVIVPILQFASVLPGLIAAAGAISVLVLFFSVRTIARPLQKLADQAAQTTGGDFGVLQQGVGGVDEIQQLQRALREMVERIRSYQASLRRYIEGLTEAQEAERARLSRELHDQVVQDLVGVSQQLQLAQRSLERNECARAIGDIETALALSRTALDELRRTVHGLRPVYLDDLGFVPALEALVREARETGMTAELSVSGEPRRLRPELELAAFRVAQEALSNAVRHSQGKNITVRLLFGPRELQLQVADDGKGIPESESAERVTELGHFGLVGMRERTQLAGGQLEVTSHPGQGTRVLATFPG